MAFYHRCSLIAFFLLSSGYNESNNNLLTTASQSELAIPAPTITVGGRDEFPFRSFFNTSIIVLDARYNSLCDGNDTVDKCCSCKESCTTYKDCCVDKLWYQTNYTLLGDYLSYFTDEMQSHETLYTCEPLIDVKIQTDVVALHSNSYFMIATCKSTKLSLDISDEDIVKCEEARYGSVEETFPVFDNDGHLYRSSACAKCNGIFDYTIKNISYNNSCLNETIKAKRFHEILKDCQILLAREPDQKKKIQQCFYTNPVCSDPEFIDRCHSYTAVTRGGHKNKDCARCEGKNDTVRLRASPTCQHQSTAGDFLLISSIILDFSERFNFDGTGGNLNIQDAETLISQIGFSISIFAYLCLIFTYVVFKELHNIPGLNALGMSITALVGDTIFLFSTQGSPYCRYVGIILHYLFLVSNNWVLVVCYDFAWTFNSSTRVRKNFAKWVTVAKYSLLAFLTPSAFVVPAVIINELGVVDVGYGSACWITHYRTRVWSFIIPVGVTNLISIFILCRALVKIYQVKVSSNKILHRGGGSGWETFGIAFKLVFGLLFVEVIGFVQVPGETNLALSILNDVVRSSKGAFLCSLYLFNGKVLFLFRSFWAKRRIRNWWKLYVLEKHWHLLSENISPWFNFTNVINNENISWNNSQKSFFFWVRET